MTSTRRAVLALAAFALTAGAALRRGEDRALITTPSPPMMGFVKEGKLKLLGVASKEPAPLLPGVKQISGTVPGFSAEVWFGLLAPAGTPSNVIAEFNQQDRHQGRVM